jgi:uncharacterized protein with von Willebrand factor type A (vWA) domain
VSVEPEPRPDDELPLLALFYRLREAELPLGIEEYELLPRAMLAGFGFDGLDSLMDLCRMLWIKTPEEEIIFRQIFAQWLAEQRLLRGDDDWARQDKSIVDGQALPPKESDQAKEEDGDRPLPPKQSKTAAGDGEAEPGEKSADEDKPDDLDRRDDSGERVQPRPDDVETVGRSAGRQTPPRRDRPRLTGVVQGMADEATHFLMAGHGLAGDDGQSRRYRFKADYLPITQRQMKQSWRYLRKSVREGPLVELDVEATVDKVALEGRFFQPVLRPRRINRAAMVLLVDQEGSMTPFGSFSRRLVDTAVRGGRLGQTNVYYFSNYPRNVLYCNPYFSESRPLEAVIGGLHPTRTAVLIFSDAGAARDRYSFERVDMTRAFLRRVTQTVRHVAWLNPMPRERWAHTSAAAIAQSVPMFEISREGLQDAIDVLRGRTITRR